MAKRGRSSSKIIQTDILRYEDKELFNSSSSNTQDKKRIAILGSLKSNKNHHSLLKNRETNAKSKPISIDTINFRFPSNKRKSFKLQRFFIKGNGTTLYNPTNKIYEIIIDINDDMLYFKEYTNIRTNSDMYQRQTNKEDGLFNYQDDENISYDIEGYRIDKNGEKINTKREVFCDNIDLDNFLFTDGNNNYYYINYERYDKIFELFKEIYKYDLELELYDNKSLKSENDIKRFKENDEDEYKEQLEEEKRRQEEERQEEEEERQEGGKLIKKYKKILKNYQKNI